MDSRKEILTLVDFISIKTHCKFKNREGFMLRLFRLKATDQEFIMVRLEKAARKVGPHDDVVIHGFKTLGVRLNLNERKFRFMIEHEFKCKLCSNLATEWTNVWSLDSGFRDICEPCMDDQPKDI